MISSRVFWPTLIILSLVAMLACGGGSTSHTALPAVTDVYAAGYELNDAGAEIAKYWKNGQAHVLGAGVNGSFATSIAVSGNDVYVAGVEGNGTQDVAKYWKNGVPVELTDGTQRGFANSIFVSGTDLYVAGGEQVSHTTAKYWKNGVPVTLPDLGEGSLANSIFVSGPDVYVGGWVAKTTQLDPTHFVESEIASYWKNGVLTQLADGLHLSIAYSIFGAHGDIYVAGFACQDSAPNCAVADYWKNGVLVQLANGSTAGASSIFVSGADVYVAGNQSDEFAEAWKNTESVQLTGSSARSAANQVVVSGGDVYIGGAIENDAGEAVATYWKKWRSRIDYRRYSRRFGLRSHCGQTVAMLEQTMEEKQILEALNAHWRASAVGDANVEHDIYDDDAICDYPQSGERIVGRSNLQALRSHHPGKPSGFNVRRILGKGNLWITEYTITYQGRPAYTVSIMEFRNGKVVHETQYFADPFEAPDWRSQWVQRMD